MIFPPRGMAPKSAYRNGRWCCRRPNQALLKMLRALLVPTSLVDVLRGEQYLTEWFVLHQTVAQMSFKAIYVRVDA